MTSDPPTVPADPWPVLERTLRDAVRASGGPGGPPGTDGPALTDHVPGLLQTADLLLMDGCADHPSLLRLAARGAYLSWDCLLEEPAGTTARVDAMLSGWESAGLAVAGRAPPAGPPGTGRCARPPVDRPRSWPSGTPRIRRRQAPNPQMHRLAASGVLTPDNVPEPGDDGPTVDHQLTEVHGVWVSGAPSYRWYCSCRYRTCGAWFASADQARADWDRHATTGCACNATTAEDVD